MQIYGGEEMSKHRTDLANQVDQSRKVKRLEAENSRLRAHIIKLEAPKKTGHKCTQFKYEDALNGGWSGEAQTERTCKTCGSEWKRKDDHYAKWLCVKKGKK